MWSDRYLLAMEGDRQGMNVRGLRIKKNGAIWIVPLKQVGLEFLNNHTEFFLLPAGQPAAQYGDVGRLRHNVVQHFIVADVAMKSIDIEHALQVADFRMRRWIKFVQLLESCPDRWLSQRRSGVGRIGVLKYNAIAREDVDVGREVDRRVVGREVVAAQRIDHQK